ncbi:tripartite tricarboxylate transporter substrate binding protein [Verticiella sediminum]|uniref:Tripartite tricarboxylate transporter substrate binding protein n=1 Tax=Verticiella sediminum TaxID=1247510 RepID=A0A556AE74_9BURK|nr:tripartite tricarboxylate transporter substrate binding protein [Verticiella sediminum]TSH91194.1 tripartite tricarboxylate transporter substrate binding protein [Verticiella sediminum]
MMKPLGQSLSRRDVLALGLGSALGGAGILARAAESADAYPSKPIKLVMPFAAGGGTDLIGRVVAHAIDAILGQPIIVDNRPGAGGSIGTSVVAKSAPDGYTLAVGTTATHAMNEFLYGKLPYDPANDFTPVTRLVKITNVLAVPVDSPIKSFQDLLSAAKSNPGKLSYGIVAIGSSAHLASEQFRIGADIDAVGIPYNNQVTAITDLITTRLDFMFDSIGNVRPNLLAGKLRALAVTSLERSPFLPDVPTVAELGLPGFTALGWVGLFAPAGTDPAIVNKLASVVSQAYESNKDIKEFSTNTSFDFETMPPAQFAEFVVAERIKWGGVIKQAGIKL